jgi:hypothetical protein
MCLLCEDEKAYAAYMAYLDAMERQKSELGTADPNKALDAVIADIMKTETGKSEQTVFPKISTFSCDPVDE